MTYTKRPPYVCAKCGKVYRRVDSYYDHIFGTIECKLVGK